MDSRGTVIKAAKIILRLVGTIWAVVTITFLLQEATPGDAATSLMTETVSVEEADHLREVRGLNRPALVRYGESITRTLRGDWGVSHSWNGRPVTEMISLYLPRTMLLGAIVMLISLPLGVAIGAIQARNEETPTDQGLSITSILSKTIPVFATGMLIKEIAPPFMPTSGFRSDGMGAITGDALPDILLHAVLPAITLMIPNVAIAARYSRRAFIDSWKRPYVRAASIRGVPTRKLFLRHVMPDAAPPILTLAALMLPQIVMGSMVVEVVFNWPGMASLVLGGIYSQDTDLVLGVLIVATAVIALSNAASEAIVAWLDPRVSA